MQNSVTSEQIAEMLNAAETEEKVFWGKEMIVSYKLECGFTIAGRSACVDPANFNEDIGRLYCRKDAERQLWALEGYRLQWRLFDEARTKLEELL